MPEEDFEDGLARTLFKHLIPILIGLTTVVGSYIATSQQLIELQSNQTFLSQQIVELKGDQSIPRITALESSVVKINGESQAHARDMEKLTKLVLQHSDKLEDQAVKDAKIMTLLNTANSTLKLVKKSNTNLLEMVHRLDERQRLMNGVK